MTDVDGFTTVGTRGRRVRQEPTRTSWAETRLAVALAIKQHLGLDRHIAVAFNGHEIVGIGVDDGRGRHDSRSAIINVLQGTHGIRLVTSLATTTAPTPADLGMARLAGSDNDAAGSSYLSEIVHPEGNAVVRRSRHSTALASGWEHDKIKVGERILDHEPLEQLDGETALGRIDAMVEANSPVQEIRQLLASYQRIKTARSATITGYQRPDVPRMERKRDYARFDLPRTLIVPTGPKDPTAVDHVYQSLAWAIAGEAGQIRKRGGYPRGHFIASILRGPDDELLAWGLNTRTNGWTLHAEVNLIQDHHRRQAEQAGFAGDMPSLGNGTPGPTLYTTLQPCYMCGRLFERAGVELHCRYGQSDRNISNAENGLGTRQLPNRSTFGDRVTGKMRGRDGFSVKEINAVFTEKDTTGAALASLALPDYLELGNAQLSERARTVWENGVRLLNSICSGGVGQRYRRLVTKGRPFDDVVGGR